ncbi:hypothetical protein MD484_g120, partial [Candolleomyces efflorescens]
MSAQPPSYNPELYTPETLRHVQGDSKRPQSVLEYNPQHEMPEVGTSYSPVEVGARSTLNRASSPVSTIGTKAQDGSNGTPHFPEPNLNNNSYPFSQKFTSQIAGEDSQDVLVAKGVNPARSSRYQDLEYADGNAQNAAGDSKRSGPLGKFFKNGRYPLEQRIENKKRGIGIQSRPWVVYILTVAMIGVFIYELVLNGREQGSPISIKPFINPMLGPSGSALINLGSRFPPCMKNVAEVPISTSIACMNNTENPITQVCTVGDLCGFGGKRVALPSFTQAHFPTSGIPSGEEPNQWFRFILPIFLHAGIIHLLLNMFAQLSLSAQIEREMGSGGFLLVYAAAGIFGNVLGGNFSLVGVPSVAAIDVMHRPVRKLVFMTIELIIGIAIGFIPYVDNFAHIGGFVMGLLVGTVFYPVISETKRHKLIMWIFRIIAIPLAIVLFVLLTRNFYTSDPYAACSGCRYLSCIPTAANNRCKGTGLTTTTTVT